MEVKKWIGSRGTARAGTPYRHTQSYVSAVESKCSTQGRIKMHHLGRLFSRWIWVVVARVKW